MSMCKRTIVGTSRRLLRGPGARWDREAKRITDTGYGLASTCTCTCMPRSVGMQAGGGLCVGPNQTLAACMQTLRS